MPLSFSLSTFFLLAAAHSLIMKRASSSIAPESAPIFIGGWVLMGTLAVAAFQGSLIGTGIEDMLAAPIVTTVMILKGPALWHLMVEGQRLRELSLSSIHMASPFALVFIALINHLLGESLSGQQWIALAGLGVTSAMFWRHGHLNQITSPTKSSSNHKLFTKVVILMVILAVMDYFVLVETNWFIYLIINNTTMLAYAALRQGKLYWGRELLSGIALLAGSSFAGYELLKFYLLDYTIPVSVMAGLEAGLVIVMLLISALIYQELTIKKQLFWGTITGLWMFQLLST